MPAACSGPVNTPSRSIALPFEANILALRDDGRTVVVVTLDWFFASPGFRATVLECCKGFLDEESLFVAASHTHTSPATDAAKSGFSTVDASYVEAVESAVGRRIRDLLQSDQWRNVTVRFATTGCDCAVNRRRAVWRPAGFGLRRMVAAHPNVTGPCDRDLRMMRIQDESAQLVALVWGVSCHPTEWPVTGQLSSDYPGRVRQTIRQQLADDLPVLFLQGFCGDLRPPATGRWKSTDPLGRQLLTLLNSFLNGPGFIGFTADAYESWVSGIEATALRAVAEAAQAPPLNGPLNVHRSSVRLSELGLSGETESLTCHWLDVGASLRLVGISAEVCWDYARHVQQIFAGKTIWPVGYIDRVFGYLPTQSMLAEGGYEVSGFRRPFGIGGEFVPGVEDVVATLVSS